MPTIDELHEQLAIDKLALDDEVIRQPGLFCDVGEELVMAIAERDTAKEELANTDAELALEWRKKLSKDIKTRVTDAKIQQYVQTSEEHKKAFMRFLTLKTRAEKLQVLKDAFLQRNFVLRDLVTLYCNNYYEDTAIKPTKAQEASHYNANRARIANARMNKIK